MKKSEYETKSKEMIQKLETEKIKKMEEIKKKYEEDKQTLITNIIQSIL